VSVAGWGRVAVGDVEDELVAVGDDAVGDGRAAVANGVADEFGDGELKGVAPVGVDPVLGAGAADVGTRVVDWGDPGFPDT
jgi:hypothetical protein